MLHRFALFVSTHSGPRSRFCSVQFQPLAHQTFSSSHRQPNILRTMSSSTPASTEVQPRFQQLFAELEKRFQSTTLGSDKWYILATSTLVASSDPERADQLYQYICSQPAYATSPARQALVRRLREALIKSVPIVGVCKPIEAILSIGKVEREEDKDYTFTREGWQCDQANHDRGAEWMQKLYARNTSGTLNLFSAHKDFAWLSEEITYGLFLSDRQILDDVDTQLVVLPGIMSQNLPNETHWHIRGTRRLGLPKEEVQVIWDCVQLVAQFFDVKLNKVPTVEQVEYDV
ncbi:hypothetical protein PENSTE_c004G02616 [Penicillium steckii]|uniref:Carboxymuconolactone decarboxylase-like domain-containing protein n=1 Tax=Penicillium steckii TaxID=303698 RepID=A0A1V6TLH3_9EURO|nr:hypothetical protein PENSTE_c004G02616 [Penicillium steckii]